MLFLDSIFLEKKDMPARKKTMGKIKEIFPIRNKEIAINPLPAMPALLKKESKKKREKKREIMPKEIDFILWEILIGDAQ